MSQAIQQHSRTLVLSLNMHESAEAFRILTTVASGALGIKLIDWIRHSWARNKKQSGEWQVRVLDDGAKVREEERAENKSLRVESLANLERAHKSEIENVGLRNENVKMRVVLERKDEQIKSKDEQIKALIAQIVQLEKVPVTFTAGWNPSAFHLDFAHPGDNGKDGQKKQSIDDSPELAEAG